MEKFDKNIKKADSFKSKTNIKDQENLQFLLNPEGVSVNKKEDYLDKVEKISTQLYLLAKSKNIEVIKQHIVADKTIKIASETDDSFEFFYILEGTVSSKKKGIILKAGDSITVRGGDEERYFETLSDATLLYITTTPVFSGEQKRINELMTLIEKIADKDVETKEHCNRLQELSRLTAEEMDLTEEKLFNLGFASFLHDIGKSKVPTEILQKPEKLSAAEWKTIKKHTSWGREIILEKFNNSYFKKVAEIIHQHHERYDGGGYPQGLAGDEILIEAQILTVVDAYDAMTFERPYQEALAREEALEEIKSKKGKQFSPRAVEAFLEAEKKFIEDNKNERDK